MCFRKSDCQRKSIKRENFLKTLIMMPVKDADPHKKLPCFMKTQKGSFKNFPSRFKLIAHFKDTKIQKRDREYRYKKIITI